MAEADALTEAIETARAGWTGPFVETGIFGTADAAAVAAMVEEAVTGQFGAAVDRCLFWQVSVGCVAGLVLDDGRSIVCKVHQRRYDAGFLGASVEVQRAVADAGLPCPVPLADPMPVGPAWATVEAYRPAPPDERPAGDDATRAASAATLAAVVQVASAAARDATRAALAAHPLRAAEYGGLWPKPHSPQFDFDLAAADAAWIDALAAEARARREAPNDTSPVVAHTDWSHRNVRFAADGTVAIAWDWDSMATLDEPVAMGQAAATWCVTGEPDHGGYPSPAEIDAYLAAYAAGRGRPLTADEATRARAAALWVIAYAARCEHALAQRWPDVATPRIATERLATDGAALLC
ncbi:MAG: phosphotransferase [Acidimicrobiales bacterium]|nr:phosphotransferase [Acidimicrobiales bacterium]